MSTIQQQMQMYHALETVLRGAADAKQPLTLGDIWEVASIREAAPKQTHVRDKIKVLLYHKLVTKVSVAASQSGNKMSRVGYMWANDAKSVEGEITFRNSASAAVARETGWPDVGLLRQNPVRAAMQSDKSPPGVDIFFDGCTIHGGANLELFLSDVKCTVSRSMTGKVIIKIE